jgi:hypothetical protein
LIPILQRHLQRRKYEQESGDTVAQKSPWLFPSVVSEGTIKREKSLPGQWSDNRTFLRNWQKVAAVAKEQAKADGVFWTYGPAEFRHCYGTILGMCGFSGLEISRWMENSPDVALRHYCGMVGKDIGKR